MGGNGFAEGRDHGGSADPTEGDGGQQEPGVVVDEVQHLHITPTAESHVGEVGLPGLVRQLGGEADVGAAWPLLRLCSDVAVPGQNPVHGRRGQAHLITVFQVPGQRVRASVQALLAQLPAQPQEQVHNLRRSRCR